MSDAMSGGGGAGAAASGGDPYMAAAQGGSQFVSDVYKGNQDYQKKSHDKHDAAAQEEDSMRGEANYRQDRAILMDQLGHMFAKHGWKLPETNFPGQGTSRPLPGDQNPYAGYDVNPSYQTHQPLDSNGKPIPFNPNDPNSTVSPNDPNSGINGKSPLSDAQVALAAKGGPNIQQAQATASQFKTPEHKAKAFKADLLGQAVGGGMSEGPSAPPEDDPLLKPDSSMQFQNASAQTTTPLPQIVGQVGRRYGY